MMKLRAFLLLFPLVVPVFAQTPPPITPYAELTRVTKSVTTLNTSWQFGLHTVSREYNEPYMRPGAGPRPKQMSDNLVEELAGIERNDAGLYQDFSPAIQKAHADAIAQMKLTPNQIAADTAAFNQANTQAQASTPIASLVTDTPNPQRFAAMADYLANLLKQLGDYK